MLRQSAIPSCCSDRALVSRVAVTVYALNLFGDAVRDLLDPRLRGAAGRYGGGHRPRRTPRRG